LTGSLLAFGPKAAATQQKEFAEFEAFITQRFNVGALEALALEDFLTNENEDARVGALAEIINRVPYDRFVALLGDYTDGRYNVVVWLDRFLYAPAPISS
jgi:hypothetical protein